MLYTATTTITITMAKAVCTLNKLTIAIVSCYQQQTENISFESQVRVFHELAHLQSVSNTLLQAAK